MVDTPAEAALTLKLEMLEVLRQLNRAEMEQTDVVGVEPETLRFEISRGRLPQITVDQVRLALRVLVANGYARELTDAEYAWSLGRTVGDRFAITTEGKEFLVRETGKAGRID